MDIQKDALRSADRGVYLKEVERQEPKETFKALFKKIKEDQPQCKSILDVGCAAGEFLSFVRKYIPSIEDLTGLDVIPEFLERAKKRIPDADFILGGIDDPTFKVEKQSDVVVTVGVFSIFFDPEPVVKNMLSLTKPNGRAYFFEAFNEEPLDVRLTYRYAGDEGPWETGHNVYSMKTMELLAKKYQAEVEWTPFQMPISLPKTEDPMRAWTEPFRDNPNTNIYGTGQFKTLKILSLKKNG